MKINKDGASRGQPGGEPGMAGAGWNSQGSKLMAMATPIGITTSLVAETWEMLLAVRMATTKGRNHLCFETDSSSLESLIKNGDNKAPWIFEI